LRTDREEPAEHAQFESFVCILDCLLKHYAPAFDLIAQFALLFFQHRIQFIFQSCDLVENLFYLAVHDIPLGDQYSSSINAYLNRVPGQ
jgi:hypothetical protein